MGLEPGRFEKVSRKEKIKLEAIDPKRGSRRRFRGYWVRQTGSGREGNGPPGMSPIVPGCEFPKESFNGRGWGPLTPLRRTRIP